MLLQLKELIRNRRNKPFTFIINSVGMILAFTVVIAISSHICSELNHDSNIVHRDRIVRLEVSDDWGLTPGTYGPWMTSAMPEVEQFCRVYKRELMIRVPEQGDIKGIHVKEEVILSDSSYASMFSLQFLRGGWPEGTDHVILSEQTAFTLFGKTDPVGKRLVLNNNIDLTVTGVFREVTNPALYRPKMIVSVSHPQLWTAHALHYGGNNFETYLLLRENTDRELLRAKFSVLYAEYLKESRGYDSGKIEASLKEAGLRDYTDIYFHPRLIECCRHGNLNNIGVLILVAFLVLLAGILNYGNMITARVVGQFRNIGLKYTLGAGRRSLVFAVVFEAVVVCFLSMLLAFFITRMVSGRLESWTGLADISGVGWAFRLVWLMVVPAVCGIVSGLFPAVYLTRIRNRTTNGKKCVGLQRFKNVFMIVQLGVSIGLILTTLFVYKQLNYVKTLEPGYDRNNVLVVYGEPNSGLMGKYPEFRDLLLQSPDVLKVGISSDPVHNLNSGEFNLKLAGWGKGRVPVIHADVYLPGVLGLEVTEGKKIDQEEVVRALNGKVLINQQMAHAITALYPRQNYLEGERVSVLKDFHYRPMYESVAPMYLRLYSPEQFVGERGCMYIRFSPGRQEEAIARIKNCFNQLLSDEYYRCSFLADDYNRLYDTEELFAGRLLTFSVLVVVLACMGLLAFSVFFIEQNMKNIGIRKVVGATEIQIMGVLNRRILSRLLVGFLISCPFVYMLLSGWFSRFAYKTTLSWWVFALAFVGMCGIILLFISPMTCKAAKARPADSLKSE